MDFEKMKSKEIYIFFGDTFDKIYHSFMFMNISKKLFSQISLELIENSKDDYNDKEKYKSYLKFQMNRIMSQVLKEQILNEDNCFIIINNYINQYFINVESEEKAKKCFSQLIKIFNEIDFTPDLDLIIKLINNNQYFENAIKFIADNVSLTYENIEKKFNNQLNSIIEAYCIAKNIEIQSDNNTDNEIDMNDSIILYFNDIQRYPLLSADEEKQLAMKIEQEDESARTIFINSNLRLVVSIAKKFTNKGVPFEDLIQEGNFGLIRAVDKFDYKKGYKFSTYASWWIKQSIKLAIANQSRIIRIPVHKFDTVNKLDIIKKQLMLELDREPTEEELAKKMAMSVNKVRNLIKWSNDAMSYDIPINDNNDTIELLLSDNCNPGNIYIDASLKEEIHILLDKVKCNENAKIALLLRCGFIDGIPKTFEEIGKYLKVTRQRAFQLTNEALGKICILSYCKSLASYIDYPEQGLEYLKQSRLDYYNGNLSFPQLEDKDINQKTNQSR